VREVVSTWYGTFLRDGPEVLESTLAPTDPVSLADRARQRRAGERTPEDRTVLELRGTQRWVTRDRRLVGEGVLLARSVERSTAPASAPGLDRQREALLLDAERALADAWDPSVHVEEAVRAEADLDRVRNLIGERLGSWASRDAPELDPGDHAAAARSALAISDSKTLESPPAALLDARRSLAELYTSIETTHRRIAEAIAAAVPERTPNLNALLGPDLTARMLAQAGGLDRLARLPASTIQVLGAERAFFEHLRGRAPPPRHGYLFLHPAIQPAPRNERGKLARALAGKVAIAARLDQAGAAVNPALARSFDRRRSDLAARRGSRAKRGSRPPLDGAAGDR
jgi:nucleolar protein 56